MARLIVKFPQQKNLLYRIGPGTTRVGRGEHCHLRLPNVSVSRDHAQIRMDRQGVTIEDVESQNGLIVNGKTTKQHALRSGDEIQIGSFSLIYLTDTVQDNFYKGRYVNHLPLYDPDTFPKHLMNSDGRATVAMDLRAMQAMAKGSHLMESARLVSATDPETYWYPLERGLTFGSTGMIKVDGWFNWGVVAEIRWEGGRHTLTRNAWWVTCTVNNQVSPRMVLSHNARVQIGGSRFIYVVDE